MKRVTKSLINAVENGAKFCKTMDNCGGDFTDKEITDHHAIGQLMEVHAKEVVRLLIKLNSK